MQKGNTLVIAVVIIALLLVGGGVAYVMTQSQNSEAPETMDAMETMVDESSNAEPTDVMMEANEDATDSSAMESDSENAVTIDLTAENYSFSQEEIRVNQGDTVTVVLNVTAGMHDWVVDEFDARTAVISTGDTAEVTFVADEAGEFEYYCSVGNHRQLGMVGTLIIE